MVSGGVDIALFLVVPLPSKLLWEIKKHWPLLKRWEYSKQTKVGTILVER